MHNKIILNFKFLIMNVVDMQKSNSTFNIKNLSLTSVTLFGMTAKDFREQNSDKKGNLRDYATVEQLVVLSNLESINSMLIKQGLSQRERLIRLNEVAISQIKSLVNTATIKRLK